MDHLALRKWVSFHTLMLLWTLHGFRYIFLFASCFCTYLMELTQNSVCPEANEIENYTTPYKWSSVKQIEKLLKYGWNFFFFDVLVAQSYKWSVAMTFTWMMWTYVHSGTHPMWILRVFMEAHRTGFPLHLCLLVFQSLSLPLFQESGL